MNRLFSVIINNIKILILILILILISISISILFIIYSFDEYDAKKKESKICEVVQEQIKLSRNIGSLDISDNFNFILDLDVNEVISELNDCGFSFGRNEDDFPNTIFAIKKFNEKFLGYSYIQLILNFRGNSIEKYKANIFYKGI